MADLFLGIREEAGQFDVKDEKTGEVTQRDYHYFLVNIATEDVEVTQNTVGYCGYDLLGIGRNGTNDGKAVYKDWRKISPENMESIFGTIIYSCDQFKRFVGKPCEVFFNRKGNISKVTFPDGLPTPDPLPNATADNKKKA